MTPACSACGLALEWGRWCPRGTWRLFRDQPQALTKGRYYRATEDTPFYDGFHNLWNADWTHDRELFVDPPELGEDRTLRRGYSKGAAGVTPPPPILLGDGDCMANGERESPPGPDRPLPGGMDGRCYIAVGMGVPLDLDGGILFRHRPEELPALNEGDPVGLWRDATENRLDLEALGTNPVPALTQVWAGGLPALVFSKIGAARALLAWGVQRDGSQLPLLLGTDYTLYVVATPAGPVVGGDTGPQLDGPSANKPLLSGSKTTERAFVGNSSLSAAAAAGSLETHIWHVRRSPAGIELGLDGIALAVGFFGSATPMSLAFLSIDSQGAGVNRSTIVSEVVGYPFRVGDAGHAANVAFLKARYGL